jgi:hypothetical protein
MYIFTSYKNLRCILKHLAQAMPGTHKRSDSTRTGTVSEQRDTYPKQGDRPWQGLRGHEFEGRFE